MPKSASGTKEEYYVIFNTRPSAVTTGRVLNIYSGHHSDLAFSPLNLRIGLPFFFTSQMTDISTNSTFRTGGGSMIPWLHFTGGDYLLFKSIHPSSSGAIAGACLALFILAVFERWIASTRAALEVIWRRR